MIRFFKLSSQLARYLFYAMAVYFIGILTSIAIGYFKFASNDLPMYFLMAASGIALLSFLLDDAANLTERFSSRNAETSIKPEAENQGDE
ncbi:hypothetical protein [Youngiibacter fragilis]|uniref:Uncharacterized protein n=1 Tax=Youngiibacter fragilis 232.1 TaxID=994573 RepID=V7I1J8_9CLOT|nr:hypothetical protein [Youngiibacter fragilis]ETA79151.1 hypothetical protein T472_0218275 [Youngiibacter fragilis 232.1]